MVEKNALALKTLDHKIVSMEQPTDVGVIVGRFQVPELHQGHIDLINSVRTHHSRTIIFLGLSNIWCTKNNPLDYESREIMIKEAFPDVIVAYIEDHKDNSIWSDKLDKNISLQAGPTQSVMLYGSRDSFIRHYTGKYPCTELVQESYSSGTEIRKRVSKSVPRTKEFRSGAMWALLNRYTNIYPTVDIAVTRKDDKGEILLLLASKNSDTPKKGDRLFRLPGGFVNPRETYEHAAQRELIEEIGSVEVSDFKYFKSFCVKDWRYRDEQESITTAVFTCNYNFGMINPNDDIDHLQWFKLDKVNIDSIVSEHKEIITELVKYLTEINKPKLTLITGEK